jgi:Putative Flp pilus-assembly TadE/G-like
MRDVKRGPRDDRGAVLVWVGVSLVALLGMGAMVIDVGALYAERRDLQNGADAAALAVAKDCAEGDCDGTGAYGDDEYDTAEHYADENANDGRSDVPLVCGDHGDGAGLAPCPEPPDDIPEEASGWVLVDTSTRTEAGDEIEFVLAPVLDAADVGKTVTARAVAAWGPVGSGTTIPLIFSTCEFGFAGGSLDPPEFPDDETTIHFHDNQSNQESTDDCAGSSSGGDFPGGFGWLAEDGDCEMDIDIQADGGWVADKPGNAVPNGCDPETWQDAEVLLPLFDETNELSGSNGRYHLAGFVGFRITGYRFSGASWNPPCTGNDRCIRGFFTRIVSADGGIGSGGGDYGARAIRMIG